MKTILILNILVAWSLAQMGIAQSSEPLSGEYTYFEFDFACQRSVHPSSYCFLIPTADLDSFFSITTTNLSTCEALSENLLRSKSAFFRADKTIDRLGISNMAFGKPFQSDSLYLLWYDSMVPTDEVDSFLETLRKSNKNGTEFASIQESYLNLFSTKLSIQGLSFVGGERKYLILQKVVLSDDSDNAATLENLSKIAKVIHSNQRRKKCR